MRWKRLKYPWGTKQQLQLDHKSSTRGDSESSTLGLLASPSPLVEWLITIRSVTGCWTHTSKNGYGSVNGNNDNNCKK